jgi:hypothetical protein
MPLLNLSGAWYPVEFVYQAFGKTKDANDDDMVK